MNQEDIANLLLVLAGLAALVAAVVLVLRATPGDRGSFGRRRAADQRVVVPADALTAEAEDRPLPAVVVNPTKFDDLDHVRAQIAHVCTSLGWDEPVWLETTRDDPGEGQARRAVEQGADVVMACGGDGTVRSVGQALAGTGVAMGLLPAGTGNLLARNLDLHMSDIAGATRIALTGDDRLVDVGWVALDGSVDEHAFLVMAGMGFDAEIMAHAPEALKAKVGPIAYTVAGLRQLKGRQARVRLQVDDEPEVPRRVRTVLVGNCGRLLGGIVLMPDAKVDDGWLDVVSIAPEGLVGWVAVFARVVSKQRRGHPRVEHWRVRRLALTSEQPEPAQVDGDPVGEVRSLHVRIEPAALVVRVPA